MSENREGSKSRAIAILPKDGISMVIVEGVKNEYYAQKVCAQIAHQINSAYKKGMSYCLMALPPPARLTMMMGKEINLKTTMDGRIIFQMKGNPKEGSILLPGDW